MALVQFVPNMTHMSLQLAHVVFPSQRDDIFRVEIKSTADNMPILIWLESKRSKKQWQLVVVNMNDHSTTAGDIVLPCYFILSTLKRALTANSGATPAAAAEDCDVDVIVHDGKMKLVLHLQAFAGLKAEYSYHLDEVELAETAILEAKIDDLEMEFTQVYAKLQAKDSEIAALQNDMEILKALVGKTAPQRRHGFVDLDADDETFPPKLKGEKKHKRG